MQTPHFVEISAAEWEIMRIVWANNPLTAREIIDTAFQFLNWKEGTIKSLINRLTQKGILVQNTQTKPFLYSATIDQETANYQNLNALMSRICTTKRKEAIEHLIHNHQLSQDQCKELIQLLEKKIASAPLKIECQCHPGQCNCHSCS
ncbi:CopY/TcrY family copper transport repressor [Facklamia sp. DSM 111018]|uniref:CopY/TcrY family copper transport repressor n=1 Tax=Facklamia lactis TaxID=2749967 RepID=A0ABS0LQH9_9LACT|nr:CopY/TcrY family copper transport repressor [Facklamia lactis]MBG9986406.1 CopY/TcrY family copper transport repressor [Facklamia lactis]